MPVPLHAVSALANASDVEHRVDGDSEPLRFYLYDLLRREQALATSFHAGRGELDRILDLIQRAYGDVVGTLVGVPDEALDQLRDGDWTLRDLLRHAVAVELRYAAQVEWSASRGDDAPLAIPTDRLPCDRLAPPDPQYGDSRTAGMVHVLELLGQARIQSDARLARIPEDALGRPSVWGTLEMTVRMRLHQAAAHLTEVAVQAEKMLASRGAPSEAARILRHCCATRGSHERWSDAGARSDLDARYAELGRS